MVQVGDAFVPEEAVQRRVSANEPVPCAQTSKSMALRPRDSEGYAAAAAPC